MIRYVSVIFFCLCAVLSPMRGAAQSNPYLVDVPVAPDEITRLDERCNYIVSNYWKRLNYKGAFSSLDRMDATLGHFLSLTPFATADTVYMAIDMLLTGVEKADAKNLIPLARMAERWCGNDTSEYASEQLMLPFAQAVADNKKLKGPEKDYYALMARRLANSRRGVAPADFVFTAPDGSTKRFSDITEPTVLLFFYDPADFASRLARTRLGNDFVVKTLIRNHLLSVVALYDGAPDTAWNVDANDAPDGWIVGAAPGIGQDFMLKKLPQFFFLDEDRVISDKDFSIDAALLYFNQFLKQ